MELILHSGKEISGNGRIFIVISRQRVNVGDFLVETPFTGANLPDTFKEFVKIVFAKALTLLEPFIIQHKPLNDKFIQGLGRPNAKLRSLIAVHPIAHGNNGVKIVIFQLSLDTAIAFLANCLQNGKSCLPLQIVHVLPMNSRPPLCGHGFRCVCLGMRTIDNDE